MDDDFSPEIPDFVPEEFNMEAAAEKWAQGFVSDEESVADFLNLIGYITQMSPEDRDKLRENLSALAFEFKTSGMELEKTEIPSDILFIGSDGRRVVKGFHYSRDVLGEDGPVIMPTSSAAVVLGAYSDEFIKERADQVTSQYETYEEQAAAWEMQMSEFALDIAAKYDKEQPPGLDEFLKSIE